MIDVAPIRVLMACDRLGYGNARLHGAGRLMIQWTRALVEHGVDVTTVILREPGPLGQQVLEEGLPFRFLSRHPYDPLTLLDFVRIIRERDIQVLHLQAFGASTFGRLAARWTGRPAIVHVHADYRGEPKGYPPHVRMIDARLSASARRVLAISRPVADFAVDCQGFEQEQVEVLHSPVDLREFRQPTVQEEEAARSALGLGADRLVATCVARFHEIKGVDVLVEAWAGVAATRPDAILVLLGDGPGRQALEKRVAELGLADSIRFLGYREDVPTVLWASDLLIVPSRMEGLSLAALEGMATGLPVVASDVGGLPEIVKDGVNGFLARPADPDHLASRIVDAFAAIERDGARYADAARAVATEHDLPVFIARLRQIYLSLASAAEPS